MSPQSVPIQSESSVESCTSVTNAAEEETESTSRSESMVEGESMISVKMLCVSMMEILRAVKEEEELMMFRFVGGERDDDGCLMIVRSNVHDGVVNA